MQLEGAEIKDNKAESYKITFFGDVVTLKDNFGDDKLQDLDYSSIQTEYNGTEILASLTSGTDDDVRYPLISSNRIWDYAGGGVEDISDSAYPIVYNELFPALKVSKIFELIEAQYNLVFTGTFLTDNRFTNLFTWWKNRKETDFQLEAVPITFNDVSEDVFTDNEVEAVYKVPKSYTPIGYNPATTTNGIYTIEVFHYCDNLNANYSIDVYSRNGGFTDKTFVISQDFTVNTIGQQTTLSIDTDNSIYANRYYSFEIRSNEAITVYNVSMRRTHTFYSNLTASPNTFTTFNDELILDVSDVDNPFVLQPYVDLSFSAPDMKIADYFSGILSEFNLTCFPLQDGTTFQIEPLDVWYNYGGEVDITPYTIIDSIKVDRPKLYKSISFEFEKSKSFMNENFEGAYGRGYGNLMSIFPYDGGDFKIKLPFENLYFNRFTDTDLQVAYATTDTTIDKGYIPKVCNLYLDVSKSCSFYFNDGTTTTEVTSYVPLGQDMVYNGDNYSSNFGLEVSTLKDVGINNSLYQTYYEPYLNNLYDNKTRMVTLDCILPLSVLTALTLDDVIILRDKKYRINTMKTDLTSGMVNLELLSDWTNYYSTADVVNVLAEGEVLSLPIKAIKPTSGGYYTITDTSTEASFITPSVTLPYTSSVQGIITFTASANTTGLTRTNQFTVTYYNASGGVVQTQVTNFVQDFQRDYLLQDGLIAVSKILTETFDGILL
jgi:hypothetical protein